MRVPISWLKEYLPDAGDPAMVAKTLTMAGVGVEAIEGDVLTLEITSNRADLLSMTGVARDLALLTGGKLKLPESRLADRGPHPTAKVEVVDATLCPRYVARII